MENEFGVMTSNSFFDYNYVYYITYPKAAKSKETNNEENTRRCSKITKRYKHTKTAKLCDVSVSTVQRLKKELYKVLFFYRVILYTSIRCNLVSIIVH